MNFILDSNGEIRQNKQGDVNIYQIEDIPEGAQEAKTNVLAEGEHRNHFHTAHGEVQVMEQEHEGVRRLFVAVYGEATIEHVKGNTRVQAEHNILTLPPGNYLVGGTAEYDYDTEESKLVRD